MKIIFVVVLVIITSSYASPTERIISGKEAVVGEIPWFVAIESEHLVGYERCGGTLISDEWVITSYSCIASGLSWEMHFGGVTTNLIEIGRQSMTSKSITRHPNYNELTKNFDIALIHMPKKIDFNNRINKINLPAKGATIGNLVTVNIAGFGSTQEGGVHSSHLHFVDLSTISNLECQNSYGKEEIITSTVCTTGFLDATPCGGDLGGPLYTTNAQGESILVGVFSFYHKTGCASRKPTVYVRTEPLLAWITEVTGIGAP